MVRNNLFLVMASMIFGFATNLWAETPVSKIEVFGGYSLMYADFEQHREEAHGGAASFALKLSKNLSAVADFSGHFKHSDFVLGARPVSRTFTVNFLFGPHFASRHRDVSWFTHVLLGGRNLSRQDFSETNLTIALGGGLDYDFSRRVAFRLFQVDYLPTRSEDAWSQNIRAGFGFVFRLGAKS